MTLTPGAYLKCRRTAAGLGVEDVAGALATYPTIAEHGRTEWIKQIEADIVPMSWSTIVVLRLLFPFDLTVLERLSLIHLGADMPAPRLCRICAASETGPIGIAVPVWAWAGPDLCIACKAAS